MTSDKRTDEPDSAARDEIRRDIDNLAAQESDAHRLSEDFRREKDRAAAAANEAPNRNQDAVLYQQLVDVTNSKLLEAVQVLRGIRDTLHARSRELRDAERSLARLPPPK